MKCSDAPNLHGRLVGVSLIPSIRPALPPTTATLSNGTVLSDLQMRTISTDSFYRASAFSTASWEMQRRNQKPVGCRSTDINRVSMYQEQMRRKRK